MSFHVKRCNYWMILIIFIVNTSEFADFFFKSGDCHKGRQRLLVLLAPGGIRIEQFVTNCGGERLPCNQLYVYYMLSHSIDWHLLDVVHNILNMQRCHISSWSDMQLQW